jgi:hypothetical protein
VGTDRFEISSTGSSVRVANVPTDLEAFSASGDRYVFVDSVDESRNSAGNAKSLTGTQRIEVSSTLFGPRTIWHSTPIRIDNSGAHGDFASAVVVLPDKAGILIWTDPDQSDDADGDRLYELRSPHGTLTPLGVTVGHVVTLGRNGTFSFSAGGPRVAWIDKAVESCDGFTARCTPVGTPQRNVTVAPAWSPDGATLAYVEAASMSNWNFPQSVLTRWYATRKILLKTGSNVPVVVKGSNGATDPVWSLNGKSLLFVDNDGLTSCRGLEAFPNPSRGRSTCRVPGLPTMDRSIGPQISRGLRQLGNVDAIATSGSGTRA